MSKGLLLINLGTPDNPDSKSVRRYLRDFLADKRVIDLPAVLRYALLYGIILPLRTPKTTKAYQSIWTDNGSPLLHFSNQLSHAVQEEIGSEYIVALGMRYGNPSINEALQKLSNCNDITILPLFPQYSSATSGSAIEYALNIISRKDVIPNINVIRDFHDHPSFIKAEAQLIRPYIKNQDHILFSYHGLPERHIQKSGCKNICKTKCPTQVNKGNTHSCYRAQCFKTTELIAKELNISNYSIAFQSRLGRTKWIEPYTEEKLTELANQGIKNLAIVCPSFVADCLETLEEIGIRANKLWHQLTNHNLTLIPCLNASPSFVKSIKNISIKSK
jgi:protoporphyrin/coproporphyrin ferrochelatase